MDGCFVWIYVNGLVAEQEQAEEIVQVVCGFGESFSPENITITDREGNDW